MENKALEAALNALDEALRRPMTGHDGESPLITYLGQVIEQHSLLRAVHLDVTYSPEYQGIMNSTMLEITKDRFLDDQEKQSSLLKGLVGYVWSVNEVAGQLHQHFLVLIKGPLRLCIAEGTDLPRYFAETIVLGTAQCEIVKWEDADDGDADTLLMQGKASLNYLRLIQRVQEMTTR
ncbi:MAG: hypothetical protein IPH08_11185 [Rhodocyclaceae bacterium]|nr:hypothetical protein [Rhodocyclaceae bacterium]